MGNGKETRSAILDAAREVFVSRGVAGARMKEIADRAGVNKAMIHYYFNSKEELFQKVFRDTLKEVFGGMFEPLGQESPLFEKIEQVIDNIIGRTRRYPDRTAFIMESLHRNPELLNEPDGEVLETDLSKFEEQLREAASEYRVVSVDPRQVVLNILSLCIYPYANSAFTDRVLSLDSDEERDKLLENRKGIVSDTVLNWLTS